MILPSAVLFKSFCSCSVLIPFWFFLGKGHAHHSPIPEQSQADPLSLPWAGYLMLDAFLCIMSPTFKWIMSSSSLHKYYQVLKLLFAAFLPVLWAPYIIFLSESWQLLRDIANALKVWSHPAAKGCQTNTFHTHMMSIQELWLWRRMNDLSLTQHDPLNSLRKESSQGKPTWIVMAQTGIQLLELDILVFVQAQEDQWAMWWNTMNDATKWCNKMMKQYGATLLLSYWYINSNIYVLLLCWSTHITMGGRKFC